MQSLYCLINKIRMFYPTLLCCCFIIFARAVGSKPKQIRSIIHHLQKVFSIYAPLFF